MKGLSATFDALWRSPDAVLARSAVIGTRDLRAWPFALITVIAPWCAAL